MEGFKKLPKMQCFKEGGSVKFTSKTMKESGKADIAQDKKIVKKALAMHDKQEHPGEKTDLSKLKKGGRSKKSVGTVKKFKAGGDVTNVYEAKKKAGDKDAIKKVKQIKPTKAAASSAALKGVGNTTAAFKKGGKVKKYAGDKDGSYVDVKDPQALTDKIATEENTADRDLIMKPVRAAKKIINKGIDAVKSGLKGQGAVSNAEREDLSNIAKKKGGKVRKFAEGGFTTEEDKWLGGADRTDPFILARMKAAMGNKKPVAPSAPVAATVKPETSADLDPYGAANRETSADLDPYGAASRAPVAPRPAPMAAGPSADERLSMRNARPVQAPNVEQDSGVAYPQGKANNLYANRPQSIMQRFANAAPVGEQLAQLNRGVPARKNLAKRPVQSAPSFLSDPLAALSKRRA